MIEPTERARERYMPHWRRFVIKSAPGKSLEGVTGSTWATTDDAAASVELRRAGITWPFKSGVEDIPTRHLFAFELLSAPKNSFVAFDRSAVRMVFVCAQTTDHVAPVRQNPSTSQRRSGCCLRSCSVSGRGRSARRRP